MRTVSQAGEQIASGRTLSCDIVIVGGGTSGMVAAVVAAQRGKRVIVIEKNDYIGGDGLLSGCAANFGGGTDFQKEAGVTDTADGFYEDMRAWDPKADRAVLRAFCNHTVPTCHFLRDLGVRFSLPPELSTADMGTNVLRVHQVTGRGPAFYAIVIPAFRKAGGTVLLKTKAVELVSTGSGHVSGVVARDKDGEIRIDAKSTMLSCGGFQANAELVTRYISAEANYAMLRGGPTNTGDGLQLGLQARAGTRAMHLLHGYVQLPPHPMVYPLRPYEIYPRDGSVELPPLVQQFPHGIVVNNRGDRFVDETVPRIGENMANALVHQPGAIGYAIVDHALFQRHWGEIIQQYDAFWHGAGLGAVPVICESGPKELAEKLGFNPNEFDRMIREYNEAVDAGTTHLLKVPKSNKDPLGYYVKQNINFLNRISEPPFYAIMIIAGLGNSKGGLTIDSDCRVLDLEGERIDGLHAGGDTSVLWHSNYGSAYARALVTGFIAGNAMAGQS